VEVDSVFLEEGVDFHAGFVAEETADFAFGEAVGAVGLDSEGFHGGAGWVGTGGDKAGCEIVGDVEGDLHGFRVAEWVVLTWDGVLGTHLVEDFFCGAGAAGGDVGEAAADALLGFGEVSFGVFAGDDLLDVLLEGEAAGVGFCGELGFDLGLEFEVDHG
jgi:hypothetical protein